MSNLAIRTEEQETVQLRARLHALAPAASPKGPRFFTPERIAALHRYDYPMTEDLGGGHEAQLFFDVADDGEPIELAACYVNGVECSALLGEQRCDQLTTAALQDWLSRQECADLDSRIPTQSGDY